MRTTLPFSTWAISEHMSGQSCAQTTRTCFTLRPPTNLILRSVAKRRVSKDGQHQDWIPPFETHAFGVLLRVRAFDTKCTKGGRKARPYFFLAAPLAGVASAGLAPDDLVPAATPVPVMPKRSLKRCTRPPRSMLWRTPVQAGWVFGSISRRICAPSLPQVDFVSNDVPSVITTVILW